MICDSDPIFYACISKGTTVLADLSCGDPDLEALAFQCLEKTPDFHGFYSHTLRKRMYCFLIDEPLIYFAVVDEDLGKPQVLEFLNSLKDAFATVKKKKRIKSLDRLTYRCFQDEFNPVFGRLIKRQISISASEVSIGKHASLTEAPLLANHEWYDEDAMMEVALDPGVGKELSRDMSRELNRQASRQLSQKMCRQMTEELRHQIPVSMRKSMSCMGNESLRQQAWRSWKRQVCIALVVDLLLCFLLLLIWLAVCKGFQCTKK